MGILEVAQTAQTQLDKLCAETGVPENELRIAVFTAKPDGWIVSYRLKQYDDLFMQPIYELRVTEDGTVQGCDDNELLRRSEFEDACRARAAELAPEPEPFDAEQAVRDAGGWIVPGKWTVVAVGTNGDALIVDGARGEIKRRAHGYDEPWSVGMIADPRAANREHIVYAVLPGGVYVSEREDLSSVFVSTPDTQRSFDTFDDAVRAAVALATETQL